MNYEEFLKKPRNHSHSHGNNSSLINLQYSIYLDKYL